jgi:hypothetical protein
MAGAWFARGMVPCEAREAVIYHDHHYATMVYSVESGDELTSYTCHRRLLIFLSRPFLRRMRAHSM